MILSRISVLFLIDFRDDIVNFRSNVQTSSFCNVSALSFNGTLFYWAVENEIFKEEFHVSIFSPITFLHMFLFFLLWS